MKVARALLVLALAALPAIAGAQMYKWKDAQGRMHFTQVPPPGGIPYETLGGPAAATEPGDPAAAAEPAAKPTPVEKPGSQPQQTQPPQSAAAPPSEDARQQACARAMERLAYLDARTARRIATKDAAGNVSRMTEEEFQRERNTAQDEINRYCN